jgi:MFS family permease
VPARQIAAVTDVAGRLPRGHRDFRLLWSGHTVSAVGNAVTLVALPLVALDVLHATTAATALLTGLSYLPTLLFGLPAGAWVDRRRKRPLMIAADTVSAVALLSVPVASALGGLTVAQLYAVALVLGGAQLVFQTADSALLPQLLDRDRLVAGNAALQTSQAAAMVGGPGVAGLLVQAVSAAVALAVDAVSFVVSAVTVGLLPVREPAPLVRERRRGALRREVADGLRYVLREPVLRVLTLNAALANLALIGAESLFVPFLSRTVGLPAGAIGLVMGLTCAGGVLGAAVAAPLARRLGTARATLLAVLVGSPAGLLVPLADDGFRLALFVLGGFVLLSGAGVYNVIVVSYRQAATPAPLLGRVTASMRVVLLGTVPLGSVLAAVLASAMGTRGALWVAVLLDLLPAVVLLASPLRTLRDLPPLPDREDEPYEPGDPRQRSGSQ